METKEQTLRLLKDYLALESKGFSFIENAQDQDATLCIKEYKEVRGVLYFNLLRRNFIYGIGGWINIRSVEELLGPLLIANGFVKSNKVERTLINPIIISEKDIKILNQIQDTPLNKESDFQNVTELFHEYVKEVYYPFWNKFSNLQVINNEIIEKIPQMELSNFIPGPYMDLKKLIIMKLCKNDRYEEYLDWLRKFEEEDYQSDKITYKNRYNLFIDLVEVIK